MCDGSEKRDDDKMGRKYLKKLKRMRKNVKKP